MKHLRLLAVLTIAALLVGVLSYFDRDEDAQQTAITFAPYGKIDLLRFRGGARNVIIYFSDDEGWRKELGDEAWGEAWPNRIVAGIDLPQFRKAFEGKSCADYAGAVKSINEEISRVLKTKPDEEPFLVGRGAGSAIAFAAAAQSKPNKIQGVVARDFCPVLREDLPPCRLQAEKKDDGFLIQPSDTFKTPLVAVGDPAICKAANLYDFADDLPDAHVVVPNTDHMLDLMVSVVTQTNERTSVDPTVTVAALEDLPIVEVPSELENNDDRLAIVLTGDGGWADIDRTIGEELAKQGVATIGFNSLKYFWEPQKPEDAAADLERVIRHYMTAWHRSRILLVGFSFGADLLPFLQPHLPRDIRQNIALTALLAPSAHASFEISVGGWVGVEDTEGPAVAPAIATLKTPLYCVESAQEDERPCDGLTNTNLETSVVEGDHHFDGNYMPIVERMLEKTKSAQN